MGQVTSSPPRVFPDVACPTQNSSTALGLPREAFPIENRDCHTLPNRGSKALLPWDPIPHVLSLAWTLDVGDWPGQRTGLVSQN